MYPHGEMRVGDLAWRLLQETTDQPAAEGDAPEPDYSSDTKGLRIAAVFIIFAAGLAGSLPCLFFPVFRSASHPLPRILRALSAGIILALALVHVFPEAVEDLDKLTPLMPPDHPYNVAGPTAIFGALLMVALESGATWFVERRYLKMRQAAVLQRKAQLKGAASDPAVLASSPPLPGGHVVMVGGPIHTHDDTPHTHTCMGAARMSLEALPTPPRVRDQILALLFELGCIFHSVIIGVALGVDTDNRASVEGLVIALCFHQWLEGVPLATFIMRAHISFWKGIAMILLYSLTCPIGIAIGIAVAGTYNADSTQAYAVQGTFNALSAGMLLYISLVQLVAEDFSRRDILQPKSASADHQDCDGDSDPKQGAGGAGARGGKLDLEEAGAGSGQGMSGDDELEVAPQEGWVLAACHLAMFLGAALMSMLAIWA